MKGFNTSSDFSILYCVNRDPIILNMQHLTYFEGEHEHSEPLEGISLRIMSLGTYFLGGCCTWEPQT